MWVCRIGVDAASPNVLPGAQKKNNGEEKTDIQNKEHKGRTVGWSE
jgi:hypothetical protein